MPFKSKSQVRALYAKDPKLAAEWTAKYGLSKNLPEKVGKGKELSKALKKKRRSSLPSPPSGFGQRIEGASTSNTRSGY